MKLFKENACTPYQLIRSRRKTIAIEIRDGRVIVRAPQQASEREINQFVAEHEKWISKHLAKAEATRQALSKCEPLSPADIQTLAERALKVIPDRVKYYADKMGVTYGRITIRNQRTKWGSCSGKGNLNFNCLLMLAPPEVLDSVVVHELCHLKEMNHSKKFYEEVYKILPNYQESQQWLKENGSLLMGRMTG